MSTWVRAVATFFSLVIVSGIIWIAISLTSAQTGEQEAVDDANANSDVAQDLAAQLEELCRVDPAQAKELQVDCGEAREIAEDGPPGAQGPPGEPGERGPRGSSGDPGPGGVAGADGNNGATGLPGNDGADGSDGSDGSDGATGPQGAPGNDGATGPQGPPPESFILPGALPGTFVTCTRDPASDPAAPTYSCV